MKKFILMLAFGIFIMNSNAQNKNFIDQPYIEVNASYDTSFAPDEIFLNISISEAETKNKISLEQLENDMVKSLNALGINTDKNLKVTDIQSNIKKYILKQKDVMKSRTYELKVSNAVTAAKVFIALEKLGIGNANIDHVGSSKMKDIEMICYEKAMLLAKRKAEIMANALGTTIGRVIYIADNDNGYSGEYEQNKMVRFTPPRIMKDEEIDPALLEFEKMQINRTIQVKFALK